MAEGISLKNRRESSHTGRVVVGGWGKSVARDEGPGRREGKMSERVFRLNTCQEKERPSRKKAIRDKLEQHKK